MTRKTAETAGHSFKDAYKRAMNPMVVLMLLSERPMYAYEMVQSASERSDGKYVIPLLYPTIYRLCDQGYVSEHSKEVTDGNRVRQYYQITDAGRAHLKELTKAFDSMTKAVRKLQSCHKKHIQQKQLRG